MPDYSIRLAREADLASIRDCVAAAYLPWIVRIGQPPGPLLDDYAAVIRNHHVSVALSGEGELCAIIVLIQHGEVILLDNIAVNPAYQRQGIGQLLMDHVENHARNKGYDYMHLYTHIRMTENIHLYRQLGYVDTERKVVNGYARLYMVKALNGAG